MLLSIIIPVYNTKELYLRECIDSCLKQNIDDSDYEIICIDDGSTNESFKILNEYQSINSNFKAILQINQGVSQTRNNGIFLAKGDYIWFVDSDDFIRTNCMKELKNVIDLHKPDRIYLGAYHFFNFDYSNINNQDHDLKPNHSIKSIFCTRSLYKRDLLLDNNILFDKNISLGEDQLFNFEFDNIQKSYYIINDVDYFYRITENSLSHSSEKYAYSLKFVKNHLLACEVVKKHFDDEYTKSIKTIRYLHCDLTQIMVNLSTLNFSDANKYIRLIIDKDLFPFLDLRNNRVVISLYTNLYSFVNKTVCRISKHKFLFIIMKVWSYFWKSKPKKYIEKNLKNILK